MQISLNLSSNKSKRTFPLIKFLPSDILGKLLDAFETRISIISGRNIDLFPLQPDYHIPPLNIFPSDAMKYYRSLCKHQTGACTTPGKRKRVQKISRGATMHNDQRVQFDSMIDTPFVRKGERRLVSVACLFRPKPSLDVARSKIRSQ